MCWGGATGFCKNAKKKKPCWLIRRISHFKKLVKFPESFQKCETSEKMNEKKAEREIQKMQNQKKSNNMQDKLQCASTEKSI